MPRVAIYARFSSDRQSACSAEDQVRICRDRAEREGWEVVEVYSDLAISGANIRRPGMTALLADLGDRAFDIVLAEALDRIARDQEDISRIYKRISFAGARLVTLADGDVSELQIGFRGTMDAMELKKIGEKTRRGQLGSLRRGHIPGGLSYGYAVAPKVHDDGTVEVGLRSIVESEADVVRRIFREYAAGRSVRAIAADLNADAIPSPRGGKWRSTVIIGSGRSMSGILANPLYVGRYVWNRRRWRRDPDSRNRLARMNDNADRVEIEVPDQRIVDDATWSAVQAIRGRNNRLHVTQRRRPKHFLAQLVKCGACGGNYTYQDRARWGCSARKEQGTCSNAYRIAGAELEARVLAGLKEQLLSPEAVALVVAEYHRAREREDRITIGARHEAQRQLQAADAAIARLVQAIADGGARFGEFQAALEARRADRDRAAAELAEHAAAPVIALHPTIAVAYRKRIEDLAATLTRGEVTNDNSAGQIRALVDRIVIRPVPTGGASIEVYGSLAAVLGMAGTQGGETQGVYRDRLVAGTGFEPVTFRL